MLMQVILREEVFHNKDNEWKYFKNNNNKNCVLLSSLNSIAQETNKFEKLKISVYR